MSYGVFTSLNIHILASYRVWMIFNGKRTQNHTIWKYYEETRATVSSSLAASTDGLLKGVYCRGVSTDEGLEIAAMPRFAASSPIILFRLLTVRSRSDKTGSSSDDNYPSKYLNKQPQKLTLTRHI